MESSTIQATKRQEVGTRSARRLRREGRVPVVLYGRHLDTLHLTVPLKELERAIATGARMLSLEIGGTVETGLLKEIQYDAMGDRLLHVDMARVAMDEKVEVTVPVELHGMAKGAASGGTLDHLVQDIQVRCFPGDIPEKIRIEIADLDVGQILHVRELQAPPGVEFLLGPDTPVVTIHAPAAAEEVAAAAAEEGVVPGEPEVIGRRAAEEAEEESEG